MSSNVSDVAPISIVVSAKSAICLTNSPPTGIAHRVNVSQSGWYLVSITSTAKFGTNLPCNQMLLFNTAPLVTGNYEQWYRTVGTSEPVPIYASVDHTIYVYMVDQGLSSDNSGTVTATFTYIKA